MKMITPWLIVFTCVQVVVTMVVIAFNVIGIYLLLKPNTYEYSQRVCLIQLSVIKVLFLLAQNIPFLLDLGDVDRSVISQVCVFAV